MSLIVSPFLGNIGAGPVGMKCHRIRSSASNAKDAFCFCSAVRLATNFVAAVAIAVDDRSSLSRDPTVPTPTKPTASQNRTDFVTCMCPPVRPIVT
jgi:hypothetical protein